MPSKSNSSFVNGLIAGAGAVLALMSVGFLQYVDPLENVQGVTTTELWIAIFLGGIVAAVAIGYEFYTKQDKVSKSCSCFGISCGSKANECISLDSTDGTTIHRFATE